MAKNSKKTFRRLTILCVLIGFAALATGIVAAAKQEYIIAAAMVLVAAWQIVNYRQWKRNL